MRFLKISALLMAALFILGLSSFSLRSASAVSGLGYIEVQRVFKEYKETIKAQERLSTEEESFKKEFEESQKKIEEARKKGKGEEEIKKLTDDLEKKLSPKREKLLKLNETLTLSLQKDIIKAAEEVAKTLGLEVVVDKQAVIFGGTDITEMVLRKLNK